jgi:hypothetical protein
VPASGPDCGEDDRNSPPQARSARFFHGSYSGLMPDIVIEETPNMLETVWLDKVVES